MNILKYVNCVTWNLVRERKSLNYLQLLQLAQTNILKIILFPALV